LGPVFFRTHGIITEANSEQMAYITRTNKPQKKKLKKSLQEISNQLRANSKKGIFASCIPKNGCFYFFIQYPNNQTKERKISTGTKYESQFGRNCRLNRRFNYFAKKK